jgi:hypothetical protein
MQRILDFPRIHFPGGKVAATRSWRFPSSYCSRNAWRFYLYSLIRLYDLVSIHRDNTALPQLSLQFFSTTLFNTTLSSLQQSNPALLMCMLDLRRTDLSFLNLIIAIVLYYKIFKFIVLPITIVEYLDITPCILVNNYTHFGRTCCISFLPWRWRQYVPPKLDYMPSHSTKQYPS